MSVSIPLVRTQHASQVDRQHRNNPDIAETIREALGIPRYEHTVFANATVESRRIGSMQ